MSYRVGVDDPRPHCRLLAMAADAHRLVLLADVRAVMRNFDRSDASPLTDVRVDELDEMTFSPGSMRRKIKAGNRFATNTARRRHRRPRRSGLRVVGEI